MIQTVSRFIIITSLLFLMSGAMAQYQQVRLCEEESIQFIQNDDENLVLYFKQDGQKAFSKFHQSYQFKESGLLVGVIVTDTCSYTLSDTLQIIKFANPLLESGQSRLTELSSYDSLNIQDTVQVTTNPNDLFNELNLPSEIYIDVLRGNDIVESIEVNSTPSIIIKPEYIQAADSSHLFISYQERFVYKNCQELLGIRDTLSLSGDNFIYCTKTDSLGSPSVCFYISGKQKQINSGNHSGRMVGIANFSNDSSMATYASISVEYDSINELYPGIYNVFDEYLPVMSPGQNIYLEDSAVYWPDFLPNDDIAIDIKLLDTIHGEFARDKEMSYYNTYTDSLIFETKVYGTDKKLVGAGRGFFVEHTIINRSAVRRNSMIVVADSINVGKFPNGTWSNRSDQYTTGFIDAFDTLKIIRGVAFPKYNAEDEVIYGKTMDFKLHYGEEEPLETSIHYDSVFVDETYFISLINIRTKSPLGTAYDNSSSVQTTIGRTTEKSRPQILCYEDSVLFEIASIELSKYPSLAFGGGGYPSTYNKPVLMDLYIADFSGNEVLLESREVKFHNYSSTGTFREPQSKWPYYSFHVSKLDSIFPNSDSLQIIYRARLKIECINYSGTSVSKTNCQEYRWNEDLNRLELLPCLDFSSACFEPFNEVRWTLKINHDLPALPNLKIEKTVLSGDYQGLVQKENDSISYTITIKNDGLSRSDSTGFRAYWFDPHAYSADEYSYNKDRQNTPYPLYKDYITFIEDYPIPSLNPGEEFDIQFSKFLNDTTSVFMAVLDPEDFIDTYSERDQYRNGDLNYEKIIGPGYCASGIYLVYRDIEYWIDSVWLRTEYYEWTKALGFGDRVLGEGEKIKIRFSVQNIGVTTSLPTEVAMLGRSQYLYGPYDKLGFAEPREVFRFPVDSIPGGNKDFIYRTEVDITPSDFMYVGEKMRMIYQIDPDNLNTNCYSKDGMHSTEDGLRSSLMKEESQIGFLYFSVALTDVALQDIKIPEECYCGEPTSVSANVKNESGAPLFKPITLSFNDNFNNTGFKTFPSLTATSDIKTTFPVTVKTSYGNDSTFYKGNFKLDLSQTNSIDPIKEIKIVQPIQVNFRTGNLAIPEISKFDRTSLTWKSSGSGITYDYIVTKLGRISPVASGTTTSTYVTIPQLDYGSYKAEVYAYDKECKLSLPSSANYERKPPPPPPEVPPISYNGGSGNSSGGGSSGSGCPIQYLGYDAVYELGSWYFKFKNTHSTKIYEARIGILEEGNKIKWFNLRLGPNKTHSYLVNPPGKGSSTKTEVQIKNCSVYN